MSRDAAVGHPLLTTQHPDDHIGHAVLGLNTAKACTSEIHHEQMVSLLHVYLFSQCSQFFCPGLDVGQRLTDVYGLLPHASGSVPDVFQTVVSQLLELDVQRGQVGAALQLRGWVAEGE